jgi:uroporphyrinogen decarboxylase
MESMSSSGADVLSNERRHPNSEARKRVGERVALQGNFDSTLLLGPKERIVTETEEILRQAGPLGHIMNLGHGILPPTPVDNARTFIETTKSYRHQS